MVLRLVMKNALIFWMVCLKGNTDWTGLTDWGGFEEGTRTLRGQGADGADLRGFFERERGLDGFNG